MSQTKLLLCDYISKRMCCIDFKAKTHGVCWKAQLSKAFSADSVMRGAPGGQSVEVPVGLCLKPQSICYPQLWEPLLHSGDTEGHFALPNVGKSIPEPWTKPQASRMGLACLLVLFPTSYMWRACGPRAEHHRLASGTNGPGFGHGQTD